MTGDRDSGRAGRMLRLGLAIGLLASAAAAAAAEGGGVSDREGAGAESAPGPAPPDPDKLERAPRAPVAAPKPPPAPPSRGAHAVPPSEEDLGDDIGAADDIVVEPDAEQNTRVPDPDRLPQAPAEPAPGGARP